MSRKVVSLSDECRFAALIFRQFFRLPGFRLTSRREMMKHSTIVAEVCTLCMERALASGHEEKMNSIPFSTVETRVNEKTLDKFFIG